MNNLSIDDDGNALCTGDDKDIATSGYGLALRSALHATQHAVGALDAAQQFHDAARAGSARITAAANGEAGTENLDVDDEAAAINEAVQLRERYLGSAATFFAIAERAAKVAQCLCWCAAQTEPNPLNNDVPDELVQ